MPSYPLRVPESLNELARQRAVAMGLSFNAFICHALASYLQQLDADVGAAITKPPEPDTAHAASVERPVPQWATDDPKPALGTRPTKRQRRALAEWHERERWRRGEFAIPDIG